MPFDESITYIGPVEHEDPGTPNSVNAAYLQIGRFDDRPNAGNRGVQFITYEEASSQQHNQPANLLYYDDGTNWIPVGYIGDPAGTIKAMATPLLPIGYLRCEGQLLTDSDYPRLASVLQNIYGGDLNNGTFRVPDLRGMALVGRDGPDDALLGNGIGDTGGERGHVLSEDELASHDHVQEPHRHTNPVHDHNLAYQTVSGAGTNGVEYLLTESTNNDILRNIWSTGTVYRDRLSTEDASLTTDLETPEDSEPTGISDPHNNIQPSMCIQWVIKY